MRFSNWTSGGSPLLTVGIHGRQNSRLSAKAVMQARRSSSRMARMRRRVVRSSTGMKGKLTTD